MSKKWAKVGNLGKYWLNLLIMKGFLGSYECKIDDKGRLKLPASLVKQMEDLGTEGFVLKRSVFQPCLELYPMKAWQQVMEKVNGLNRFVKKNADFIRVFTAGVKVVEADASGRLQVSKDLTAFAKLSKEVVLTAAGDLLEIWDKQAYEAALAEGEADFAALAEEVMGGEGLSL